MRTLLLAALLLLFTGLRAQTIIINGEKTDRLLKWEDFSGTPDRSTDLFAYTYWYVTYKWGDFPFRGDTAKLKLEVTLELEKRSWKKPGKVSDSLLVHEQGHFNIGRLFAGAFLRRVNATVLRRSNYEAAISAIFKEELEKYKEMEKRYDSETEHFHNREQQRKWDEFFTKELKKQRAVQ